ncbi:MAG: hypothetical protein AB7P17_11465 [Nitrospirales bacterium]|nr:hypothetical protein [Nitrospirales bacterium]
MMHDDRVRVFVRFFIGLIFVLYFVGGKTVLAESETVKDPLVEHLEFIGYQCDQVEQGIRAKHASKIHIYITFYNGGIRLQTGFPGKPMDGNVETRYRVSNRLVKHMKTLQIYWSEDGNLFAMAWMPGTYEKARFSAFMEAWEQDTALLRQSYEELKPFLKEETSG